jgi:glycosyltransferase involved in cell wall biosynthesis
MITYVFPPAAWVGAHRTLKYCKYLGALGWTPVVLTARPIGVTFRDENLVRQLPPEVAVHRTFDVDPAKWEAKLAERKLNRQRMSAGATDISSSGATPEDCAAVRSTGVLTRLKELIKAILKDNPDSHIFWVPFAFVRGIVILLKQRVDVIYCTTPPHSSHFAAFLLAKCFRKPYVLDFRDPWYVSGSVRVPEGKIPWLLQRESRAKRAIIRGAARVICVSAGERDELHAEFPELGEDHFTYITNGYDPEDLPISGAVAERSPQVNLIHAGTIYPGIAGEFFAALQHLVASDPGAAQSIQVQLLGEIAEEYIAVTRQLEAAGVVKIHGLQPHANTLQMLQASDVPVILMGGTKYLKSHLPSKFYEYLHAGKPILAIAQEGELTEMARQSGLGIIVPPQDVDSVVQALQDLVADHAAGRLSRVPNRSYIRSFERAALTAKLAGILDGVMEMQNARS